MKRKKLVSKLVDYLDLDKFSLVDVGAAGDFDKRWKILGKRLSVVGFEPGEQEYNNLVKKKRSANIKYYNFCLADKPGQLNFLISRLKTNSSCLKPNFEFLKRFPRVERFDVIDEVSLPANDLDTVLSSERVDFIKLDVQGSELNILKGASQSLEQACGLEVEVEFSTLYDRQPLFSDVDQYLRGLGFSLFDLRPCYWKRNPIPRVGRGQIIFGDALYLKDYISLETMPVNLAPIIMSAVVYKKYDFAVELINYFHKKGNLSFENRERIKLVIFSLGKTILNLPHFKGKTMLINWLENVLARLKSASWARYDSWR